MFLFEEDGDYLMLQLTDVTKVYPVGDGVISALKGVSIDFRKSEFVAVLGPSGCGKTTLLNIIGGLDSYSSGDLIINGKSTKDYKDIDWDTYRNHSIGFVFQSYNLISHQTALSNVEMALKISGISRTERRARAIAALEQVGLSDQIHKKPNMMSGGQMQRVAIARALVNDPDIILADEPTGALDSETSLQIMEILKTVAQDRLVIMVTHNPELADEYSTRIIRLRDGLVISDSNPVVLTEQIMTDDTKSPSGKARLDFRTALGLSGNNLLTKKGRTLLTAFAGAIGIIGIALILALSNGMNDYIAGIESDTMGSYPIELEKETFDMNSMMEGDSGALLQTSNSFENTVPENGIFSNNIVADTISSAENLTKKNNLGSFKTYLDDNFAELENSVSAIEYGYDITPLIYRSNQDGTVTKVSPTSLIEDNKTTQPTDESGSNGFSMGGMSGSVYLSGSTSSAWTQVADNDGLREKQYELLEGSWPQSYNEVALVIDGNNEVSDFTLYTLGLMDMERMKDLVTKVENGESYSDPQESFEYSDAIGLEFKVFAQSNLYKESSEEDLDNESSETNEETKARVWIDKSKDNDYVAEIFDSGASVVVTAVLRSNDNADISSGVIYTSDLTEYLIHESAESSIVKQQQSDPRINVLTGEAFDAEEDGSDSENKEEDTATEDASSTSEVSLNTSEPNNSMTDSITTLSYSSQDTQGTPAQTQTSVQAVYHKTRDTTSSSTLTVNDSFSLNEEGDDDNIAFTVRFLNYDESLLSQVASTYSEGDAIINTPTETPTRASDLNYDYSFIGWKSSTTNSIYTSYEDLPLVSESVDYYAFYYASPKAIPIPDPGSGIGDDYPDTGSGLDVGDLGSYDLSAYTNSDPTSSLDMSLMGIASSGQEYNMGSMGQEYDMSSMGLEYDMGSISGGGLTSLSDDQISVLLAQMSNETPSSYEEVLEALGYADSSDPASIALYPTDFEGKDSIEGFIDGYNSQVSSEADKVVYNDLVGIMTSSITSIVNIISYILIAFVAISLIVSSIMIAIITYISVLERTKEIGVLRALGASKNDVSKIFNAETIIEGLVSGALGVGVALLLCIPINAVISALFGAENIASLPLEYSLILIAISVVLTLIAGFVPSRMAAKKDPVLALRTE